MPNRIRISSWPRRRCWASRHGTRLSSGTASGTCWPPDAPEPWGSACCPAATAGRSLSGPARTASTPTPPTCSPAPTRWASASAPRPRPETEARRPAGSLSLADRVTRGERGTDLVGERDGQQPLLQGRPGPGAGRHQEPALEDAAALHQEFGVGARGEALGAGVPGLLLGRDDRPVVLHAGRPAEAGRPVLEPARLERQHPGELVRHLVDKRRRAGPGSDGLGRGV